MSLSYGFAPGVVQPPSGYPPAPAMPSLPYPTGGGWGGMPMPVPNADYAAAAPQMPPMPMPPMPGDSSEDAAQAQEIPFQALSIPIAEGMFSSVST